MTVITEIIEDLAPNTVDPNNPRAQSAWFSYVRNVYSRGAIVPPTKREFMREWNYVISNNSDFVFDCVGKTFDEHKQYLKLNIFPEFSVLPGIDEWIKIKTITWVRMIMAFNMYAEVRRSFRLQPCNNVDFIGSLENDIHFDCHIYYAWWKNYFHGRCVVFIEDGILLNMIHFTQNNQTQRFWQEIFSMYDNCILSDKY